MRLVKLSIVAIVVVICSCRSKEVFPDLAKQMQGTYSVNDVALSYASSSRSTMRSTGTYNPKDSGQIGQIVIRKIDALSVNVRLLLKRQSGETLFEDNYTCELSRDIDNKGWILFNGLGDRGGAYIVDDKVVSYNYLNFGGYASFKDFPNGIQGAFTARLSR